MKKRFRLWAVFGLLGPGLLAALADNDAGGVIAYGVTGAKFGYSLFLPLVCCVAVLTYTVQEMAMRLGVASSQGYHSLVKERYGKFWMGYQLFSLLAQNILTLMTEFMGMSAGLVVLGLPLWLSVLLSVTFVLSITLIRGYAAKEKLAIFIGLLNMVFVGMAFFLQPNWGQIGQSFLPWRWQSGEPADVAWYLIAMVGNAVAPWMIFYQNGAYADKGTAAQELRKGRIDTMIGCICKVMIAFFLLIIGATLCGEISGVETAGPSEFIAALGEKFGRWASIVFGLGLFNAGLLASITVSLSSSWSVAQSFGWSQSLNDTIRKSPKFYGIYFGSVILSALLVLIPGLPLNGMAVLTQVLAGLLITPVLFFLVRLTSDKTVMGDLCSTRGQKVRGWLAVAVLGVISLAAVFVPFL